MKNNYRFNYNIDKKLKNLNYGHNSKVIWFFGLSGSGKSTILNELEKLLFSNKIATTVIDGDDLRAGLNSDLGFEFKDRSENIRRVSELSKILINNGQVVLCSLITPLEEYRKLANKILNRKNICWIFVDTSIKDCIIRDPKGLYKLALKGKIKNFTGIDQDYEIPEDYDIKIDGTTDPKSNAESIIKLLDKIIKHEK